MNRNLLATSILGAAIVLGACSSSTKTSTASSSTPASSAASSSASSSPAASSSASTTATGASLATATNAKVGQAILVDGKGMTVYLFANDGTSATSQVPAGIKANWPPVAVSGTPSVGSGLDASKLVVQTQADGTKQLAYNGHLLYYFVGDKAAGDANGQGLGGIWYVLSAAGTQVS